MSSEITYRTASIADAGAVAALHKDNAIPGANGAIPYSVEEFTKFPNTPQALFFLAECDGELVGFCLAYDLVIWCYVDILVVRRDFRGRGVAREMLKILERTERGWRAVEFCHLAASEELGGFADAAGYSVNGDGWTWRYKLKEVAVEVEGV